MSIHTPFSPNGTRQLFAFNWPGSGKFCCSWSFFFRWLGIHPSPCQRGFSLDGIQRLALQVSCRQYRLARRMAPNRSD